MIYRTLHSYILRELLRVFLLTAATLTTVLAFGGTFKPLTKQGVEIGQLMVIVLYLMPAMLAYAIPISALFAAVLVYWRMSTDNELTACRAGGLSFVAIVMPALLLGFAVASVDLVAVNYVVPKFLRLAERSVRADFGQLIVSQIGRQEAVQYDRLTVSADRAVQLPPGPDPNVSVVELYGLAVRYGNPQPSKTVAATNAATTQAATRPVSNKPQPESGMSGGGTYMIVAEKATLTITNLPTEDAVEIQIGLSNASGFDAGDAFKRMSGSFREISPNGKPYRFSSVFRSKAKFYVFRDLLALDRNPWTFPPVAEVLEKIETAFGYLETSRKIYEAWTPPPPNGKQKPLVFKQLGTTLYGEGNTSDKGEVRLYAGKAYFNPDLSPQECVAFTGTKDSPIRLEQWEGATLKSHYTCDVADLVISADEFTGTGVTAALRLREKVLFFNDEGRDTRGQAKDMAWASQLVIPPELKVELKPGELNNAGKAELLAMANQSNNPEFREMGKSASKSITTLSKSILSELNSRGSFAVSCVTLVLFGAALGILMRGQNPLAVFVVGFVPSVILVLLITAGREVTEGPGSKQAVGLSLIWAGNAVLLLLVVGVYAKLLRR